MWTTEENFCSGGGVGETIPNSAQVLISALCSGITYCNLLGINVVSKFDLGLAVCKTSNLIHVLYQQFKRETLLSLEKW